MIPFGVTQTMMLNEKRNRCSGPGGGTRHLHQFLEKSDFGGEIGSTRIVKVFSYIRYGNRRYRAKKNKCK